MYVSNTVELSFYSLVSVCVCSYRSRELAKASSKGKGKKGGGERTLSTKESNTTKHTVCTCVYIHVVYEH